jgi:UDP-N-acetylmuramoylalanine--D-glutamate ligase
MPERLKKYFEGKKILILGFGREGKSTYRFLSLLAPSAGITIADKNPDSIKIASDMIKPGTKISAGENYLEGIGDYDVVFKSPGIRSSLIKEKGPWLTSQTDLFLKLFAGNTIGITGTKGKSTTSSLLYFLLNRFYQDVVLLGNIGIPPLDHIRNIRPGTKVVFEMSSHQLEHVNNSPHISILLNLYQEHLDHFNTFKDYITAKFNIARFQKKDDWFIYNSDDRELKRLIDDFPALSKKLGFSMAEKPGSEIFSRSGNIISNVRKEQRFLQIDTRKSMPGEHNLLNMMSVVGAAQVLNVPDNLICEAINEFEGLNHRLEYLGRYREIDFYNDSIATVPEATMAAVNTLKKVDTLILGGKDRGIDYSKLIEFLLVSKIKNVIYIGEAGKRICNELRNKSVKPPFQCFPIDRFEDMADIIRQYTCPRTICLLSPAASSYDLFSSFEERGEAFKKIAENL